MTHNMPRDSKVNFGVNGCGRIGRLIVRASFEYPALNCQVTAVNDPFMSVESIAYLLKHDSEHGPFAFEITTGENELMISGKRILVHKCANPNDIPWNLSSAEYICETSGAFTSSSKSIAHLSSGATKVIISAPSHDETPTFVMGVNHEAYKPSMNVVSCASCTTNCLAPLVKVIHDNFGIEEGLMTTIHAATATQSTVDGPSHGGKDWRGGRSVFNNIIPSSTGAAKAVTSVIPELAGKLTGMAFRVPVSDVSVVDLTCRLSRRTSMDDIRRAMKTAAMGPMNGILAYTEEQVVSSDFRHNSHSCIFDAEASIMLNPTFVKLVAFYDNEWAYALRMLDLMHWMKSKE